MRLDGVLMQAQSGLDSIGKQLSTIAQNVANAGTADYVKKTVAVTSLEAGGDGMGVRTGQPTRTLDTALQAGLYRADADLAAATVRQSALAGLDAASGGVSSGSDLASRVGALRDSYSTLLNDPSNQTQQRAVVQAAASLAQGVNGLSAALVDARQTAQDGLVDDVASANAALASVGSLSDRIIAARSANQSTADLEDKRDAAIRTVAQLTGAQALPQADGSVLLCSGGTLLPTHAATGPLATGPLAIGPATIGADSASLPALTVSGQASPLAGGRIGAELALRDTELPGLQSRLESFAVTLSTGFDAAGLALFTDPSGQVPTAATAGYAQTMQVNPAVQSTPSSVRDGVGVAATTAGNSALIQALLGSVLATGAGTVAGQATDLVANTATLAATAQTALSTAASVQSSLDGKLRSGTAVSVDSELSSMVALQNSYGANARVIQAVQAMWTQLLDAVQ